LKNVNGWAATNLRYPAQMFANVFMPHDLRGNHPEHPFMPPQRHALSDIKLPPAAANLP
jgi:hypothetical protein